MTGRLLSVILLTLAGCMPSLKWQFSPPNLFDRQNPQDYPSAPAIILSNDLRTLQSFALPSTPYFQIQRHLVIEVLNRDGLRYSSVKILLDARQRLVELQARTISPSGIAQEVETASFLAATNQRKDLQADIRAFQFPSAQVGSLLELAYTIESDGVAPYFTERIDRELPVLHYSAELRISPMLNYRIKSYNTDLTIRKEADADGLQRVGFRLTDIPAQIEEWGAPAWQSRSPWWGYALTEGTLHANRINKTVAINRDWQSALAPLAAALYFNQGRFFTDLQDSFSISGVGCQTRVCVLERALARVRQIPLRNLNAAIRSRPLRDVVAAGSASAVEKTLLLWYLLNRAGLSPEFAAMIREQPGVLDPRFPIPSYLNHLIIYLPQGGDSEPLWLDPSCEDCALGEIPSMIAGVEAVVFKAYGSPFSFKNQVQVMPVTGTVRGNQDEHHYVATIDALGNLQASVESIETGRYLLLQQLELRNAGSRYFEEALRKQLASRLPTAQLRQQYSPQCEVATGRCRQHFAFSVPNFATVDGDSILVPLTLLVDSWGEVVRSPERRFDLQVRNLTHDEEVVTFKMPEGYVLSEEPAGEQLKSSAVDTSFAVTVAGQEVTVRRLLETRQGSWPKKDYPEFRAAVAAYAGVRQKVLVFRRATPQPDIPKSATSSR
jgi:hypothetical protein